MNAWFAAVRVLQKALNLPLPVGHQMRRHNEQQRIALRLRHSGQGLHGFAQTHLIRQQRARGVAKIGRALALKVHQRTLEECRRRIDALRRLP